MFTKTRTTLATIAALSVSTAAYAVTPVSGIDVTIDLDAIETPNAASHWNDIEADLETAIIARLTDQTADDGANISVDINELALASAFGSLAGIEDSSLSGDVKISNLNDNSQYESYTLSVTFDHLFKLMPADADRRVIVMDSKEYYDAMITTFADRVAEKLQ